MADKHGVRGGRVRAYCVRCQHIQLFRRFYPEHSWHAFLSIVTGGLWLISWVSVAIVAKLQPWRCQRCGWHLPRTAVIRAPRSRYSTVDTEPSPGGSHHAGAGNNASESSTDGSAP
jgi:hypothetical protein